MQTTHNTPPSVGSPTPNNPTSNNPSMPPGAAGKPTVTAADAASDAGRVMHTLPPTAGAEAIVRKWTAWSAGFGLVPLPFLDFATTTGFSLKMLHSLSKYYGIEFRTELGRSAIASLLGGASAPLLAVGAVSLFKSIPLLGLPLAVATGPIFTGGITYAIGRVFTAHFGSGGTLFDFDPEKYRTYFQEQINVGKDVVKRRETPGSAG